MKETHTNMWLPHATVATIIFEAGKFLLVKEYDARGNIVFNQPAGHIEAGETIIEAAARETLEETGYACEFTDLIGLYTYLAPSNNVTYHRLLFAAKHPVETTRVLDQDIIETAWLSYEEMIAKKDQMRSPIVLAGVEDFLAGKRFPLSFISEHAAPVTSEF